MADEKIEIRWSVDDGYVGKDRPQSFTVDLDDFDDFDVDSVEFEGLVDEFVQTDFEEKVRPCVDNLDEIREAVLAARAREDGE